VASEYSDSALSERPVKDRVDVYMSFRDEAGERFMLALDPTPPHKIYVVNIDAL
jgi:hypothetical protein